MDRGRQARQPVACRKGERSAHSCYRYPVSSPVHAAVAFGLSVAALSALAPCATPQEPEAAEGTGAERPGADAPAGSPSVVADAEQQPADGEPIPLVPDPPPDPALVRVEPAIHSALTPSVVARLRELREGASHRDDVFVKLGGSSVESRAFLHCFAYDGDNLDLADRGDLAETLEFFRGGNAAGSNPFARESEAAQVGWSLRQGLGGRPSRAVREARAIDGRFALVFFGGNDVQARRPRSFAERLERMLRQLLARGVIPVIGATSPRGDDPVMDVWAQRYNRISRALAQAWRVPYLDFYVAQSALPGRGLAGDGVHPNTLLDGGRGRACVMSEDGLTHGSNQRNLRTLELLDRLRRAVVAGEGAPDPEPRPMAGEGTREAPLRLTRIPFGERFAPPESSALTAYGCDGAEPSSGPERVYRVRVEEETTLEVNVFANEGARTFLLGPELDSMQCRKRGEEDLEVTLPRGVHYLVVELSPEQEDEVTVVIDRPVPDAD